MTGGRASRLKTRVGHRNGSTQGLTMVELLLSLTLLVLIAGFLAGGLQMARRAFAVERQAAAAAEVDQAVDVLVGQVAAAFPLTDERSGKLDFDGRPNALAFTRLDQGRANRAGLQHAIIRQTDADLTIVVNSQPRRQGANPSAAGAIVLLSRVADIRFNYFGAAAQGDAPAWRSDWSAMDRLPELVSIRIEFKDAAQAPITARVALRQR